jgi:hypothetical protein
MIQGRWLKDMWIIQRASLVVRRIMNGEPYGGAGCFGLAAVAHR